MISIDPYSAKNKGDFERIWLDWLTNTMKLTPEKEDAYDVKHPVESYINSGGAVFYANENESCIGIVAIKKLNATDYEFCKLVVTEAARGKGLGTILIQKCINFVSDMNGKNLYLQSFEKLKIALELYKKLGFLDTPAPEGMSVKERTEVIMRLSISD